MCQHANDKKLRYLIFIMFPYNFFNELEHNVSPLHVIIQISNKMTKPTHLTVSL